MTGRGLPAIDEYLPNAGFSCASESFIRLGEGNPGCDQRGDPDASFGEGFEGGLEGSTARSQDVNFVDHDGGEVDLGRSGEGGFQNQRSARSNGVQRQ